MLSSDAAEMKALDGVVLDQQHCLAARRHDGVGGHRRVDAVGRGALRTLGEQKAGW
jgi:hypothetical protein